LKGLMLIGTDIWLKISFSEILWRQSVSLPGVTSF
jgi:hypothetical protein